MQSKSYTISPNSDGYDSNALTSVLRVFAIVFFVGGLIGGYVLGKQFSDIQNLFATSYRDRVDFSWGGAPLLYGSLPRFPARSCLRFVKHC